MRLSVLVPVYNEEVVVERCLKQVLSTPLPENLDREVILVDDCSTDGTFGILERLASEHPEIRLFRHPVNRGKGAAIRTAVQQATGDFSIIQDADLEYDPSEYSRLLRPLLDGRADVVFGSRYLAGEQARVLPFWHSVINKSLTLLSNMFCNQTISDMETGYKVFRTDLLKSIPIRSERFGFEPEVTVKCAKRRFRIYEVPISYHGRTYEEGKKIRWRDGLNAVGVILKYWLIDDLYLEPYGRAFLNNLSGTPQYLNWMTAVILPHMGNSVLEIGAGIGNLSARLMGRRSRYVAADHDPLYLHTLQNRFLRTPNVSVAKIEPSSPQNFEPFQQQFDTALCLNVLEYAASPASVLQSLSDSLVPEGRLIVLVPQSPSLYGTIDKTLGHRRRYCLSGLSKELEGCGLRVEHVQHLNKIGTPAWWIYSRLLKRTGIDKLTLKLFDITVWFWRRVDRILPWRGLSLVVSARKRA